MTITQASYVSMAQASPCTEPLVIGVVIAALVLVIVAALITRRITKEWATAGLMAMLAIAVGTLCFWSSYDFVQRNNPVYQSESQKIVHNVKEKYDVATVDLSVPGTASGFIRDGKTGNYLSTAWINRAQDSKVSSEIYDLVVDANTGEPTLKKADSAASQTDPSTFLRK